MISPAKRLKLTSPKIEKIRTLQRVFYLADQPLVNCRFLATAARAD